MKSKNYFSIKTSKINFVCFFVAIASFNCVFAVNMTPLRLQLQRASNPTTIFTEVIVAHNANATDGLDVTSDIVQFGSNSTLPNLYLLIPPSSSKYVINSLAPFTNDKKVKLGIVIPSIGGNHYFVANDITAYTGTSIVNLVDSGTTPVTITNLRTTPSITYNFAANAVFNNRFYLLLSPPAIAINPCASGNSILIRSTSMHPVSYVVSDSVTNNVIASSTNFIGSTSINNLTVGTYKVEFTNIENASDVQYVSISGSTNFAATISTPSLLVDINNPTANFVGNATGANANATYTWNFGGSNNATGTSINYTFPGLGNYVATLTVTNDSVCSASTSVNIQVVNFNEIEDADNSNIKIYADDTDIIIVVPQYLIKASVSITNLLGQKQYSKSYSNIIGKQKIDTQNFKTGIYVVNFTTGTKMISKKIIIEK